MGDRLLLKNAKDTPSGVLVAEEWPGLSAER